MNEIVLRYRKYRSRVWRFIWGMLFCLGVVIGIALLTGSRSISWQDVFDLWQGEGDELNRQIIYHIRLPRIFGALFSGVILALSGVVMQILLRNPLASPYTLGISNAAAFGASFGIVFLAGRTGVVDGESSFLTSGYIVTWTALAGSLCGLGGILCIIRFKQASIETIVLSGVIINSLFSAGITVIQYLADHVQLASIVFWNFGDLGRSDWDKVGILCLLLLPMLIYFYLKRWDYKVLAAGDDYARSMGVYPQRTRLIGLILTSLCTAIVVSFFGVIAFVGLVVPHIVRKCIGDNEEFLLIATAIFGGMFLLLCDTLARSLLSPIVLPVGILTSFLGAPLFLFLLIRQKK